MKKIFTKYNKIIFFVVFGISVILVILPLFLSNIFEIFENKFLDFRFKYFNQDYDSSKEILYIDIDELSLESLGSKCGGWPWKRGEIIADHIISYVMEGNPTIFLFDILYPQITSKSISEDISPEDLRLIDETMFHQYSGKNISHAMLFDIDFGTKEIKPFPVHPSAMVNIEIEDKDNYLLASEYNTFTLPFKELFENTTQFHSVTDKPDSDGVSRNYRLIIKYDGKYYPSMALVGVIKKLNVKFLKIINGKLLLLDENNKILRKIPITRYGDIALSFYNKFTKNKVDNTVSQNLFGIEAITVASVILSAAKYKVNQSDDKLTTKLSDFKDKIVIIGASAMGLKDIKNTPIIANIAGPYIHMTAISNILNNNYIYRIPNFISVIIILISIILIISTTIFLKSAYIKNLVGFGYISFHIFISMFLFKKFGIVLDLATTLIASVVSYLGSIIYLSLTEAKDKQFLKATFGSYLAPELIDQMFENKSMPTLGGESKYITAYFTDIQGFSTFSEKLTAVQLVELLNEYLSAMTNILLEEKGTLDKYEGDAIIAFIGAPLDVPDHTYRACKIAIKMQTELGRLREKWSLEKQSPDEPDRNTKNLPEEEWAKGDKWPKIVHKMRMRIGINTGEIVVGNMGSKIRMNYTMMGDSVNLAARLEAGAKQYGVYTMVSEFTLNYIFKTEQGEEKSVKDFIEYRYIDKIVVVGKSEPVSVYEVICLKGELTEKEKKLFEIYNRGIKHYLNQEWDLALSCFVEASKIERFPDAKINPSLVYIKRCEHFKQNPPAKNWDGRWVLTEK